MELNKISANIRPRLSYEAMDLGFIMVRHWWSQLFLLQTLLFVVFGSVFYALCRNIGITVLLLWWFKPVMETIHLQFLGRALFNRDIHLKELSAHKFSLLSRDLFAKLLWRRISPMRSFSMPVSELERLSGVARLQRVRALSASHTAGPAIWLTLLGSTLELVITANLLMLAYIMLPSEITGRIDWNQMMSDELLALAVSIATIVAMYLVMPFYVAAGFCLYINKRTWLEGWDIELTFRQMSARAGAPGRQLFSLVFALLMGVAGMGAADRAVAVPQEGDPSSRVHRNLVITPAALHESRRQVSDILEGPDYHRFEEHQVLRPIGKLPAEARHNWSYDSFLAVMARVGEWIARWTEVLLWAFVMIVIIAVARAWPSVRRRLRSSEMSPAQAEARVALFGQDYFRHSLPENILLSAEWFWREGNPRDALSLLYRGALLNLNSHFHLQLDASFTEIESVQHCQEQCPAVIATYFNRLTQAWMRLAYAHRTISDQEFADLLRDWRLLQVADAEVAP